ncbi:MAG: hypothetical protein ACAI44_16455 [Candidatus Sericytochromatia bacterium]
MSDLEVKMEITIQPVFWQLDEELKQEVIDFWTAQGVMNAETASKRANEILQVVRQGEAGPIVGICTAYVQFIDSLRLSMYKYRTYVLPDNRRHGLALQLINDSFEKLNQAFVEGRLTQACGMMIEIESAQLKSINKLVWNRAHNLIFVGYGRNGSHIRLAYFDGARFPDPPALQS